MKYFFNQERLSHVFLGISYGKTIVFKTGILKPRVGIFLPFLFFVGLIMFPPKKNNNKKTTKKTNKLLHTEKNDSNTPSGGNGEFCLRTCPAVLETREALKVKIQNKVAHRQVEEYTKRSMHRNMILSSLLTLLKINLRYLEFLLLNNFPSRNLAHILSE